MKVKELIEELKLYDQELSVKIFISATEEDYFEDITEVDLYDINESVKFVYHDKEEIFVCIY